MSLSVLIFLSISIVGSFLSLFRGPIWGLFVYVYIYFNIPSRQWWGASVPDIRWSFISAGILIISCFLHKDSIRSLNLKEVLGLRWLIVFFCLMVCVSFYSPFPDVSFARTYDFFRYVVVFWVILKVVNDTAKLKLYLLLIISQVTLLSYVSMYYFDGSRLDGVGLVDAGNANEYALLLLSVLPFIFLFIFYGSTAERLFCLISLPLVINSFSMCRSRGGFFGLISMALFMVFSQRGVDKKIKYFVGCFGIGCLFLYIVDISYLERIKTIFIESASESSAGRLDIWRYGLQMVKDFPFGAGGGGFMELSKEYMPSTILLTTHSGLKASHNTYLLVLVEEGWVGLIIFLLFLWDLSFHFYKKFTCYEKNNTEDIEIKFLIATKKAFLVSFVGFLACFLVNDRLYYEGLYLILVLSPLLLYLCKEKLCADPMASITVKE